MDDGEGLFDTAAVLLLGVCEGLNEQAESSFG